MTALEITSAPRSYSGDVELRRSIKRGQKPGAACLHPATATWCHFFV